MGEKTMTQDKFVKAVAVQAGVSAKEVESVMKGIQAVVEDQLAKGIPVKIPMIGVGVNIVTKAAREERLGRNPLTGAKITIAAKPESKVLKAKVSKKLADAVLG